jgi:hypothetical protein
MAFSTSIRGLGIAAFRRSTDVFQAEDRVSRWLTKPTPSPELSSPKSHTSCGKVVRNETSGEEPTMSKLIGRPPAVGPWSRPSEAADRSIKSHGTSA